MAIKGETADNYLHSIRQTGRVENKGFITLCVSGQSNCEKGE